MITLDLKEKICSAGLWVDEIFTKENLEKHDRMYLDISTDGRNISYITKDRLDRFNGDYYNVELRRKFAVQTKPARLYQHIAERTLTYVESENLISQFVEFDDYEIKILTGDDIAKYYHEYYYHINEGTLGSSCMRDAPKALFQLYVDYCEMAVIMHKSSNNIVARAIIWPNFEVVRNEDLFKGKKLMSRIYYAEEDFGQYLKSWARQNGYAVFNGGYDADSLLLENGKEVSINDVKPYIPLGDIDYSYYNAYPYVDNFEYFERLSCDISILTSFDGDGDIYDKIGDEFDCTVTYEECNNLHCTDGNDLWGFYDSCDDYWYDNVCDGCVLNCDTCRAYFEREYEENARDDDDYDYDDDDE